MSAPATSANLGPGFDCLGMAFDLGNAVVINRRPGPLTVRVVGEGAGELAEDETNLVCRAIASGLGSLDGLANGDVELVTGFRNNDALRIADRGTDVGMLTIDQVAPLPGPGVITGDDLLESDPDLVRAFATATARAQAAVIADPAIGFAAAEASVPTIAEDPEVARAVLEATAELWAGDGFDDGAIDLELWRLGYATMERLGFIDGSVPLDGMIAPDVIGG